MRRSRDIVVALGLALVASAVAAPALSAQRPAPQDPAVRAGDQLWFAADLGRGYARIACDICDGWRSPGPAGSLRLGSRVGRRTLIGAEVGGWLHSEGEVGERFLTVGAVAQTYLPRVPDLFIKVGVSHLSYRIEDASETLSASSLGLQVGAGWDLHVRSRFYVTPSFTVARSVWGGGRLKFNGAELDQRAPMALVQLGVGVTRK